MITPKVSVVIPVYNGEAYLRQCIDSVANQTLREIEVICVDDGSTDGSAAILTEYAANDPRVKVLTREHTNAGAARNAGMAAATGEYLGFVDSDDWCEPTLFEKAYSKAKVDDADVVSWRFHQYDERTKKIGAQRVFPRCVMSAARPFAPDALGDEVFAPITYAPWGRLVRRSFVTHEGLAFQELVRTNDVYFCCMIQALASRQTIVDEVLYTYRTGTGTNLQANNGASPETAIQAWERVAEELSRRGLAERFQKPLVSASANSLFYTLNTMSTTEAYIDFFGRLQRLYAENPLYTAVREDDIASIQTRAYFHLFQMNKTPLDFLVQQENYYRERLSVEYWAKVGAQKTLSEAKTREKALSDRLSGLETRRAALEERLVKLQSRAVELENCESELRSEVKWLQTETRRLETENGAWRGRAEATGRECARWRADCEGVRREKDAMARSVSFRLGRALTWFPRKIRDIVLTRRTN